MPRAVPTAGLVLEEARSIAESDLPLKSEWLCTLLYMQGVTSLRRGENDNCLDCRGEGSCILPIAASAIHTKPAGSRAAIGHFTEILRANPDDLEVRWLLNLAHMTLGEHPAKVAPQYLMRRTGSAIRKPTSAGSATSATWWGRSPQPGGIGDVRGPRRRRPA